MDLSKKIGIGTVQFGMKYGISNTSGQTSEDEAARILDYARANGIRIIDTASAYGDSEKVLGKNDLDSFSVVSKYLSGEGHDDIDTQLQGSLKRLNIKALYGYLAHSPLELIRNNREWQDLQKNKAEGFIKKIGYSLYDPAELELLLNAGCHPDLVQIPYNYLDRRFEPYLGRLKDMGCEIHVRSVFLQGLFFMDMNKLGAFFDQIKPIVREVQHQFGNSLPAALLNHVLSNDRIDYAILGIEKAEHLKEALSGISQEQLLPRYKQEIPIEILLPSHWPQHQA